MFRSSSFFMLLLLLQLPAQQIKADSQLAQLSSVCAFGFALGICAQKNMPLIIDRIEALRNYWSQPEAAVAAPEKTKIAFLEIDTNQFKGWDCFIPLEYVFMQKEIQGIVLLVKGMSNYPSAQSIAQMILHLKKMYPKPIMAYCDSSHLGGSSYLIACAADSIYVSPATWVGYMGVTWSLKDTSQKTQQEGKEYHFLSRGQFKALGYPDIPLTDEYRTASQEFINNIYKHMTNGLIEIRPALSSDTSQWAEGKIFTTEQAKDLHLIDKACDKVELMKDLFGRLGQPFDLKAMEPEVLTPFTLPSKIVNWDEQADQKIGIGILKIGNLENKSSWGYIRDMEALFTNDDVKGIVIAIDEVGCEGVLATALHADIQHFKELYKKPVVAYIEHMALSGAYNIATAADYIIASKGANIGGIGVMLELFDNTKKNAKDLTTYTVVKAGEYADLFSTDVPFTSEKKEMLQKMVDADYDWFLKLVKKSRPALAQNESLWAEAQRYVAEDALTVGLIDELGCPFDAFNYIKRALGYSVDKMNLDDINLIIRNTDNPAEN